MKSFDEIKRGLSCCSRQDGGMYMNCSSCPYYMVRFIPDDRCSKQLHADAIECIHKLEQQNAEQAAQLAQITVEESDTGKITGSPAAIAYIESLERQNTAQAALLTKVIWERDALKADILRADERANEMQELLNDAVHPVCDYGLYLDLCDALGEIVTWEHANLLNDEVDKDESE